MYGYRVMGVLLGQYKHHLHRGLVDNQFNSYVIGDEVYILGGFDGSDPRRNDIWKSTDLGKTWELVTDRAEFGGRSNASLTVTQNGNIVLMGGLSSWFSNS
jgi:hypothetical protein